MSEKPAEPRLRFARVQGQTMEQMRLAVHSTQLYRAGDAILVWVNEGDLGMMQMQNMASDETEVTYG